jgi:hypothetical protein
MVAQSILKTETLVPDDQIREMAARLVDLIRMNVEGIFVPDRERRA